MAFNLGQRRRPSQGEWIGGGLVLLSAFLGFIFVFYYYHDSDAFTRFKNAGLAALLVGCFTLELVAIFVLVYATDRGMIRNATVTMTIATFILITISTIVTSENKNARDVVTGSLVGLVGTVVTVVGIQVYLLSDRVGSVGGLVEKANEKIAGAVATFKKDQMAAMSSAIRALENALKIDKVFRDDYLAEKATGLHPGLEAMGLSYKAWAGRLQTTDDDDFACRVWHAAFPSFFREEAFDIAHGEIVTNGRNFPILLLTTLSRLLEQNEGKDKTVVYCQVTPVHPKDWYNWPHGFDHHYYFENEFIGTYHRSLRALIAWANQQRKLLEHRRYFLYRDKSVPHDVDKFGWTLPTHDEVERPENFYLLDVPVRLNSWPESTNCTFCAALKKYYQKSAELAVAQLRLPNSGDIYAVPAWNGEWKHNTRGPLATEVEGVAIAYQRCNVGSCACATQWINATKDELSKEVQKLATTIEDQIKSFYGEFGRHWDAWKRITECLRQGVAVDFPSLLEAYHLLEALVATDSVCDMQVRAYLPAVLRKWSAENCAGWGNLYSTFSNNLHAPDSTFARKVSLSQADLEQWNVPEPEFAVFGERTHAGSNPAWKVVIATTLDYPFDVARIRIIEPRSNAAAFKKYSELANKLISNQISSEPLS